MSPPTDSSLPPVEMCETTQTATTGQELTLSTPLVIGTVTELQETLREITGEGSSKTQKRRVPIQKATYSIHTPGTEGLENLGLNERVRVRVRV